ncbi:hypothetical protein Tco_0184970 [Tanacetum coccineum]
MKCLTIDNVKPKVLAPGMYAIDVEPIPPHNRNNKEAHLVNSSTKASRSKPRSNTKKNRILPAKSDNKKKVEDHHRNNKSNLKQKNHVDSSISFKRTVINSNSNSVCKTCLKSNRKTVCLSVKPTRKKFTLGEEYPLTRFTNSKVVPCKQTKLVSTSDIVITERFSNTTQKPLTMHKRRNKHAQEISTSIPTIAKTRTIVVPVNNTTVFANQLDPNRN